MAIELKRACGYRKVGGIYLVSDAAVEFCHSLPIPLHVCPCCGNGIKISRGWTWISKSILPSACRFDECQSAKHWHNCIICREDLRPERSGLLWIGAMHYGRPQDFIAESRSMGISRRIARIPRGFELCKTAVFLAHSKVCEDGSAGIFAYFIPQRIEQLITKSQATDEQLEKMRGRGITPVIVPDDDIDHNPSGKATPQPELFTKEESDEGSQTDDAAAQ